MAELIGVEENVEQAIKAVITARLAAVPLTGVRVVSFLTGAPGDEAVKPYVFVSVAPASAKKRGFQYELEAEVQCVSAHLTGRDRDATNLAELFKHVAAALDHGDMSAQAIEPLSSIETIREGGEYEVSDSENSVSISVKVLACGVTS